MQTAFLVVKDNGKYVCGDSLSRCVCIDSLSRCLRLENKFGQSVRKPKTAYEIIQLYQKLLTNIHHCRLVGLFV